MQLIKIKFLGKKWILVGNLKEGGAITTQEAFDAFATSFAHLFPNGEIKQFGEVIGTRKDIKLLRK